MSTAAVPDSPRRPPTPRRTTIVAPSQEQPRPQPNPSSPIPPSSRKQIHYTVFIRLPFARHGFVDPQPIEWDAVKDKALWKIISKTSNSRELDWEEIATRFDVSLEFLMQQAAWLYERHFAGVRKQMQRLAGTGTPTPSATPRTAEASDGGVVSSTTGAGETQLQRTASKGSRAPSSLSVRKDSPASAAEMSSTAGTPRTSAPPFSRTPSTTTITQSRVSTPGRAQVPRGLRSSAGSYKRPASPRRQSAEVPQSNIANKDGGNDDDSLVSANDPPKDGSDSETEFPSVARSQAFRRAPLSKKPVLGTLNSDGDSEDDDNDEEESSSAGSLPFATGARDDPSATLRGAPKRQVAPAVGVKGKQAQDPASSSASASSASSAQPPASTGSNSRILPASQKPGPISPRHREQLAQLSPRHRQRDVGSDGTPSMGSSFSDLDDAGISASAIEDAVLSTMQAGGGSIASRVSGLSQAFRGNR